MPTSLPSTNAACAFWKPAKSGWLELMKVAAKGQDNAGDGPEQLIF